VHSDLTLILFVYPFDQKGEDPMNVHVTPEQEQVIKDELKAGRFHSAEEVIGEALQALRDKERTDSIQRRSTRSRTGNARVL
jgi:putative addiction module CopG family antidote